MRCAPDGDDVPRLTGDPASSVEVLLELGRSASDDLPEDFLATVAETICRAAGFTAVALNLYRPAWDDYEVVLDIGSAESSEALVGAIVDRSELRRLLAEGEQRVPGVFFLPEASALWNDIMVTFTPDLTPREHPDAWRAGDGLCVFLSDAEGGPLGIAWLDEPASGLRPSDEELRLVRAVCSHAAMAIEAARRAAAAADNARALALLLDSRPALAACATPEELFERAGQLIVPELRFERYAAYLHDDRRPVLKRCASVGWEDSGALPEQVDVTAVERLLAPEREQAGCFLGSAAELFGTAKGSERSQRNGRGAIAWRDHVLVVPCRTNGDRILGLVAIEDPVDHLLPTADRRRALRLLIDQVAATLPAAGGLVGPASRVRAGDAARLED